MIFYLLNSYDLVLELVKRIGNGEKSGLNQLNELIIRWILFAATLIGTFNDNCIKEEVTKKKKKKEMKELLCSFTLPNAKSGKNNFFFFF